MSKFSNSIDFNLRTKLDASGITQLQQQLSKVSAQMDQMGKKDVINAENLRQAQKDIQTVQSALQKSFNSNLNIFDLKSFQKELNGLSLDNLQKSMSQVALKPLTISWELLDR